MSAIQNIFRRISSALAKRQLVGRDVAGNCYYKKIESDFSGGSFERRMMVPGDKGNHITYDPKTVPPQWRQWLSKTRDEPPTEDEMYKDKDRLSQLQAKVIQLRADEQRRKMQAESMGEEPEKASGPSLDRFLGQLSNKGYGADGEKQRARQSREQDKEAEKSQKKDFEPETWQPGS